MEPLITKVFIAKVKELGRKDENPSMDEQDDEEVFNNLLKDLQYRHNNYDNSNYILDKSDDDENSIGWWESEYAAMDEEERMVVTDNKMFEIKEDKTGEDGESEWEYGSDYGDNEEVVDMNDEEEHPQDDPNNYSRSVEESVGTIPRRVE